MPGPSRRALPQRPEPRRPGQEEVHTGTRYFRGPPRGFTRHRPTRFPIFGDVRPNPELGTFYYIPAGHSGHRTGPDLSYAVAYRTPPSCHEDMDTPDAWRAPFPIFAPRSCIGPVIGVDHAKLSTAILVYSHWLVIWAATSVRDRDGCLSHYRGQHYFRPCAPAVQPTFDGTAITDWRTPFQELWPLDMHLGIGHMQVPIRLRPEPAPRYLITGAAWLRLFHVVDFLRNHSDRSNAVAEVDLEMAWQMLYPCLDDEMPLYICPERGPSPGLLVLMHQDRWARACIRAFCLRWIRHRRSRRAREWAAFLYREALLPETWALPHVLLAIGAYL